MNLDSPLLLLDSANQRVLAGDFDHALPLGEKLVRYPYFGFVEIRIPGAPPFLMFSNNDDVVAQHFLYDERPGFEAASLRLWVALASKATGVFDVGAFSGIYALAARAVNPAVAVWAFEPSRNTYNRLVNNVWANHYDREIAPLQFALGDRASRTTIRHPFGVYVLGSGESLLPSVVKDAWYEEDAEVLTADALEAERQKTPRRFIVERPVGEVDLVKLDVEGFEPNVLDGMKALRAARSPSMLIECLTADAFEAVRGRVETNYEHWFVDEEALELHRDAERFSRSGHRNVLFVNPSRVPLEPVCEAAGLFLSRSRRLA